MLDVVKSALLAERASVLVVGAQGPADALLEDITSALAGRNLVVALARRPDASWARGERVVIRAWEEFGVAAALNASQRLGPDALVVQAPAADTPWDLVFEAIEAGQQLVVHVLDASDEVAALAGLREALQMVALTPGDAAVRAVLVVDEAGLLRVADAAGQVVWRRGEPRLARLPGGRAASGDAWELVVREVEHERASLLIMGPEPTAARLLGDVVSTLRGQHVFAVPERADTTWASAGDAQVLVPNDALGSTRHAIVRSCLRQDPDGFVLQAPGAALPWELLVQTALTGHQVIAHVSDALDDDAALGSLRAALGASSETGSLSACSALPWLVVLDDAGVERLVLTDGALGPSAVTAWRRGEPVPARLRDLWPGSVAEAPPVEEPLAPLDPALVERVRALVSPHVRTAFDMLTTWSTGEPSPSKLGGVPMLGPGEPWPVCACGAALLLAVQLACDPLLPAEARVCFPEGAGWLQLFYCFDSACGVADAWTPRAPNKLLRFLPLAGAAAPSHVPEAALLGNAFDIEAWDSRPETPATDDLDDADEAARDDRLVLTDHVEARIRARRLGLPLPDEPTPELDLVLLAGPSTGDKLLGWPWWAQAPGWQTCPRCAARMQPLFQLDAEAGTGRFAADGTGHITQCPTHLDELAFAWACG